MNGYFLDESILHASPNMLNQYCINVGQFFGKDFMLCFSLLAMFFFWSGFFNTFSKRNILKYVGLKYVLKGDVASNGR